jgi:Zn-dependent protease with chaperone function
MALESEQTASKFFRRKALLNIATIASIIFIALVANSFGVEVTNYLAALVIIILILVIASFISYALDRKFKNVEAGYLIYLLEFLIYLIFVLPLWVISIITSFSTANNFFTLLYIDAFFAFIIGISIVNPALKVWKRRSYEIADMTFKSEVNELGIKMNVTISGIKLLDWSRIKIANAFQTGLKNYYVFVSNYLYQNLNRNEAIAVIAHELAHAKEKHLRKTFLFIELVIAGFANVFLAATILPIYPLDKLITMIFAFCGMFSSLYVFLPMLQRKYEKDADLVASKYVNPQYLADALLKISKLNLIPTQVSKLWNLSHPSIQERLQYLSLLSKETTDEGKTKN